MICTICYAVKNQDPRKGELVDITILGEEVMCYRCYAEAQRKIATSPTQYIESGLKLLGVRK